LNAPPRGTETILLAEDHEGLRSTAQEILQNLGYKVVVCADGKQALDLFRENPDRFDLLLMDVVMPVLSGPEAYMEMCALRPDTRVIFTTGYTPKDKDLAAIMKKGASLLQKPYSIIGLSQMIRGVLEQHPASKTEMLSVR
jgi:two-component system cell cycle sensor histidine kinase/response regulator CckA